MTYAREWSVLDYLQARKHKKSRGSETASQLKKNTIIFYNTAVWFLDR